MREIESLDAWAKTSEEDRRRVAETLASALGDEYRASARLCGRAKLAAVFHVPTSTELVIVPGGTFTMGLRADEVARMVGRTWQEGADTVRWIEGAAKANPPHEVTVRPFLCACAPVLAKQAEALVGEAPWPVGADDSDAAAVRFGRAHAARVLDASPFRLLTADEWEYVAREGGSLAFINGSNEEEAEAACKALYDAAYDAARDDAGTNGFGVWGLPWGDWVAAATGRRDPHTSRGGAAMLYPWQGDELVMQLCALGDDACGNDENGVRFALDLPATSG